MSASGSRDREQLGVGGLAVAKQVYSFAEIFLVER